MIPEILLDFPQRATVDVPANLTDVALIPDLGSNIVSLHDVQAKGTTVVLDSAGVRLLDARLFSLHGKARSHLAAICILKPQSVPLVSLLECSPLYLSLQQLRSPAVICPLL